jgi:hypothetical protein
MRSLVLSLAIVLMPAANGDDVEFDPAPVQAVMTSSPIPDLQSLIEWHDHCGKPTLLDGEQVQADQQREADLTYAQTEDASQAAQVLLTSRGDFELSWRLEVNIEGPTLLYGVETFQATSQLSADLTERILATPLGTTQLDASARQQTREGALDDAIEAAINQLGPDVAAAIIQNWYAASQGPHHIIVTVQGSLDDVDPIITQLEEAPGVTWVARLHGAARLRVQVVHGLFAEDLAQILGQGTALSCGHLQIRLDPPKPWFRPMVFGLIGFGLAVGLACWLRARGKP